MGEDTVDSGNPGSEVFNWKKELSDLVVKQMIPKRIAEKLEEKLSQKQVQLNKDQLYLIVNKIKDAINTYDQSGSDKSSYTSTDYSNQDMHSLFEAIGKLEERIINIESGRKDNPRFVTTDAIKVPGKNNSYNFNWQMSPLTNLPADPENIVVIMKWLQYLVDKCGHSHLSGVLDYYVDIGWISDDVKISLIDYSQGITENIRKDESMNRGFNNLPARDHIQSLMYIQKLKGVSLDRHFLDRIDGEISRITKKLDSYQFK